MSIERLIVIGMVVLAVVVFSHMLNNGIGTLERELHKSGVDITGRFL